MKHLYLILIIGFFGCSTIDPPVAVVKLASATLYIQSGGSTGGFTPSQKTEYTYNQLGQLTTAEVSQYDGSIQGYTLYSRTSYSYKVNLDRIEQETIGNPNKLITTYTYTDGKVTRINQDAEVDVQGDIKYLAGDTIEAKYNYSNGRFFTYRFTTKGGNIGYEQTIDDDNRLASETDNFYDDGKNPEQLLGYTDIYFSNFSANNKVRSVSNYYFSAFPQFTPVKYQYQYNEKKFPISRITTLKSTSSSSGATAQEKMVFEYK